MAEDEFDYWNKLLATPRDPGAAAFPGDGSSLPPPLSSDGWAGSNDQWRPAASPPLISADGSWAREDRSILGSDTLTETDELPIDYWTVFSDHLTHGGDGLLDQIGGAEQDDRLFDDGSSSSGVNQVPVIDSGATNQVQAAADHPWAMGYFHPMATPAAGSNALLEITHVGPDSPPAALATGPNQAPPEPATNVSTAALCEDEMDEVVGMMTTMTLGDMVRMAEECGNDEAAGRVWSEEEQKELICRLDGYAKHDMDYRCLTVLASYLPKKTAVEVALRYRWLQDKEKPAKKEPAKKAELVEKDYAGVKLNKGQGTKGAKKNNKMYPLSKEALDSKSTRELLRDSKIFMQQIEENIRTGQAIQRLELGEDTAADYFYYVKTNIDAVGKRENEFCRISMPMPPIDEQGLEEILQQSCHSSSAGKEAA